MYFSLEFTHTSETTEYPEDRRDEDLLVKTDLDREWRPATSVRQPGDKARLVAAAHPALGGDEEDGREEERRAEPHQLHRGPQAVLSSGEIPSNYQTLKTMSIGSEESV